MTGPPVLLAVRVSERRRRDRRDACARGGAREAHRERAGLGRHPLLVDPGARWQDRRDPGQDERDVVRGGPTKASTPGSAPSCAASSTRNMLASVEVVSQSAFDTWLDQQRDATATRRHRARAVRNGRASAPSATVSPVEGGIGPRIAGTPTLTDPAALANAGSQRQADQMPAVGSGWTNEQVDVTRPLPQGEPAEWHRELSPDPRLAAGAGDELARHDGSQADRDPLHLDVRSSSSSSPGSWRSACARSSPRRTRR